MSTSVPNRNAGFPRKYIYVMIGIVAVVGIVIVTQSNSLPSVDQVIRDKDCDGLNKLNSSPEVVETTTKQALQIADLALYCATKAMSSDDMPEAKPIPKQETKPIPADIQATINIEFNENEYKLGDNIVILLETSELISENIKLRVADSTGKNIHQEIITTDEFGTATSDFIAPIYYNKGTKIEATAIFVNDPIEKYSNESTITGVRMDIVPELTRISNDNNISIYVSLSQAISENIDLVVTDLSGTVIHQETITTDEFGTATSDFIAPKYYQKHNELEIVGTFEKDPTKSTSKKLDITADKIKVIVDLDKKEYKRGDQKTLYFETIPPTSGIQIEFKYDFDSCFHGGDGYMRKLKTDESGKLEVTVEHYGYRPYDGKVNCPNGLTIDHYVNSRTFFETIHKWNE